MFFSTRRVHTVLRTTPGTATLALAITCLSLAAFVLVPSGAAFAQVDPVQIHPLPGNHDSWTAILGATNMDLDSADEIVVMSRNDQLTIIDAATGQIEFDSDAYGWVGVWAPGWNEEVSDPGYGGHNRGFDIFCDDDGDGIYCVHILVSDVSQYVRNLAVICLDRGVAAAPPASPGATPLDLRPNRPNPFGPSTTIGFSLPASGSASVRVFDAQGRLMRTLVEGELEAGDHQVVWDGRTENGQMAASGTYYYELEIGAIRTARKALLLR